MATTFGESRLRTPTGFGDNAVKALTAALNGLLADTFALYFKTKNFHWHMSGPHFRDYHLLLDEQASQIFAMTDDLAERVRKVGGITLHSLQQAAAMTRIPANDADFVEPADMLGELMEDNKALVASMRSAHGVCEEFNDVATASMLEVWIDETERRTWFLFETLRGAMTGGH